MTSYDTAGSAGATGAAGAACGAVRGPAPKRVRITAPSPTVQAAKRTIRPKIIVTPATSGIGLTKTSRTSLTID